MELLILNTKLESDSIIDTYKSLIWTDRYSAYGDFEVYTSATMNVLRQVKKGYYLWNRDSEHTMIIEDIEIQSNAEFGNDIAITGRSLESILTRRIVWKTTNINGDLQNGVKRLLDDAIINPSDPDRKIENFIFVFAFVALVQRHSIDSSFHSLAFDTRTKSMTRMFILTFQKDRGESSGRNIYGDCRLRTGYFGHCHLRGHVD